MKHTLYCIVTDFYIAQRVLIFIGTIFKLIAFAKHHFKIRKLYYVCTKPAIYYGFLFFL